MIQEHQKLIRVRSAGDQLTCIVCPIGCAITVSRADDGALEVSGNKCKRGESYANEEFSDPRRVVTGTCAVTDGDWIRVPVKSSAGVAVDDVGTFLNAMYKLRIPAPVSRGDVLASDLGGTGVDLLATMTVRRTDV